MPLIFNKLFSHLANFICLLQLDIFYLRPKIQTRVKEHDPDMIFPLKKSEEKKANLDCTT